MTTHTGKYNALGFAGRVKILDALRAVCSRDEAGYAVYSDGYTDTRLASELQVTPSNIASVRRDMFGKLRKAPVPSASDSVGDNERLEALEQRVERLSKTAGRWLSALEHRLDKLERDLGGNPTPQGFNLGGNGDA